MAIAFTHQLETLSVDWQSILLPVLESPAGRQLFDFVEREYQTQRVYPSQALLFNALQQTPLNEVKVVILGQDPYHGPGQAHGLSFSVTAPNSPPPSLVNIFKELLADEAVSPPLYGDLTGWAKQGVLLLNAVLSVRDGEPNSHAGMGWEVITDAILSAVNARCDHVVFLLWGAYAAKKLDLIDGNKHTILKAAHPSPLSAYRGFLGCKHFSLTNAALRAHDQTDIDWARLDV